MTDSTHGHYAPKTEMFKFPGWLAILTDTLEIVLKNGLFYIPIRFRDSTMNGFLLLNDSSFPPIQENSESGSRGFLWTNSGESKNKMD